MLKNVHSILFLYCIFNSFAFSQDFNDILDSREFQKLDGNKRGKIVIPEGIDPKSNYAQIFFDADVRKNLITVLSTEETHLDYLSSKISEELIVINSKRKLGDISVQLIIPTPAYITRAKFNVIPQMIPLEIKSYNCAIFETLKLYNSKLEKADICKFLGKQRRCAMKVPLVKGGVAWISNDKKCKNLDDVTAIGTSLRFKSVENLLEN